MTRPNENARSPRPFIGITFECCSVYQRVYRSPEDTVYRARCPRCLRVLVIAVGPQGTGSRQLRAR